MNLTERFCTVRDDGGNTHNRLFRIEVSHFRVATQLRIGPLQKYHRRSREAIRFHRSSWQREHSGMASNATPTAVSTASQQPESPVLAASSGPRFAGDGL